MVQEAQRAEMLVSVIALRFSSVHIFLVHNFFLVLGCIVIAFLC